MTRVVCLLEHAADRIAFTWSNGPGAFEPYALTGPAADLFRAKAEAVRERLRDLVGVYLPTLGRPAGGAADPDVRRAGFALAQAG